METVSLLIDVVLLILMVCAIIFSLRLSKQLKSFKANRDAFLRAIGDLDKSAERAEQAIIGLKATAEDVGTKLQKEIDEGRRLFDELNFMNDAGNSLATRLEKLATRANQGAASEAKKSESSQNTKKSAKIEEESKKMPKSKAEEELLKAISEKKKSIKKE